MNNVVNVHNVATGQDICAETEVKSYGVFTCMTNAGEIASSDELKIVIDDVKFSCLNTNTPTDCELTQTLSSSPHLTAVSITADHTINFTGLNFPTTNQDVSCVFEGVTGVITSADATTAVCFFEAGLPASSGSAPSLIFEN